MSAVSNSIIPDLVSKKRRIRQISAKQTSERSVKHKDLEYESDSRPIAQNLFENETNQMRMELLSSTMNSLLNDALTIQFYGNISIQVNIQDGVIQSIRSGLERAIR